ncbi:MAG: hypothetical protein PW792_05755 [Acidobacteriaceae bacterium]|nr:hypothetical protein [Acidobacteriaceae bacterium]
MKLMKLICLCAAMLVSAHPIFAADNPWFGTWKLNFNKSTLTGNTVTVGKIPNGYHFDLGAVKYDVFEDGQDHSTVGNRTESLKSTGKHEWLRVYKVDGKEVGRATLRLSEDGTKLTEDITGTDADGSTYSQHVTLERADSRPDLAGTWKQTKAAFSARLLMVYSETDGGKWKVETPSSHSVIVFSLDGTPASESGPRAIADETYAYTKVSDTELKYTIFEKGVPYAEGTETVSTDGKMLKDVSWLTVKPAEKEIDVWEKQ